MMRKHWIRFGPNPMTSVLLRGSSGHREDRQVTMEAETKVTPPQSEKGLGPPELDETRKAAPLETEEVWDFRPPELRDNGFLLFSVPAPPRFVLLCYPRN